MQKLIVSIPFALASMIVITGCSSMAATNSGAQATNATAGSDSTSNTDLQAAQRRVSTLESQLAERNRELETAQARPAVAANTGAADLFPPNPEPGACYARILIPAQSRTTSETILVREAAERIEIVPARYETVTETVLVKEASTRLEVIPAVYGEAQERVMIKPATTRIVEVPAQYETRTEQVMATPAYTEWKKGPAAIQSANVLSETVTDTGEIMCLVEVPATFRTIEKRVLVSPARTEEIQEPAEYTTVTQTVLRTPATTREVSVPAEYGEVEVTRLVAPASERRIAIPAEYENVSQTARISDERVEWRQVLCEVNMTRGNIVALQQALSERGYYRASMDGIIGGQTLSAAQSFAADNNLPAGSNYIAMEVIEALNLDI